MGCAPVNKVKPISRDDTSDSTKLPHEVLVGFEKIMKATINLAKQKPAEVKVVKTAKEVENKAVNLEDKKSGERVAESRKEDLRIAEKRKTHEKPVDGFKEKEKTVIVSKAEEVKKPIINEPEVKEDIEVNDTRKNKSHFEGRSVTGIDQKRGNLPKFEDSDEEIGKGKANPDDGTKERVKAGTQFNHGPINIPIEHKITTNSRLVIGEIKDDDSDDDSKEINYHDSMEKPLFANNESNEEGFRPAVFDFGAMDD